MGKEKRIWNYFVGLVFIFTTGSIIWCHYFGSALCFSFYFFIAIVNLCINKTADSPLISTNYSFYYCLYVILLAITGTFLVYSSYMENSTIGYIVSMLASYLIISKYDFYYFRDILTNIVYYIVLFGIPIFILTEFDMLPLTRLNIGNENEMFLIYNIGWPSHFHRFAGIWHEPGACQIILNIIIWLHLEEAIKWQWQKGQLKKFIVLVLGLLFTMSTGGYIVFMLFCIVWIMKIRIKSRYKILIKPMVIVLSLLLLIILYYSSVIQDKLFSDENMSKVARTRENLVMLNMFMERPILGWGLGSKEQLQSFVLGDNRGCSNGILYMASAWGLMWLLPFMHVLWKSINKLMAGKYVLVVFIAFLLLECNERYLEFPISFLFLCQFKSYIKPDNRYGQV